MRELYERSRDRAEAMMGQISPHQTGAPTPCADWSVGQLTEHLADHIRYIASVDSGAESLDQMVPFREGEGEWRLEAALAATSLELTTHTWDLARSVGADDGVDPEVVVTLWERFLADGPGPPRGPGLIGPAVPMPASDPLHERFLGMMGRDPFALLPAASAAADL
ncbi:MAG: maleylpyruvate isomerase N-terminal domain-containing protein [Acidimicrobiales bacterium]